MKNRAVIIAAAGFGALAIAVGLVLATQLGKNDEPRPSNVAGTAEVTELLDGIPQRGNVLGDPDAPVTLVEYADIQCPYCAQWAEHAFPEIVRDYVRPGKVKIVFRGMAFIGPDSDSALRTAVAAGADDRLWHVVDLLFTNQGPENSGWAHEDLLVDVASAAGLDGRAVYDRRYSPAVESALAEDKEHALRHGIRSTPSFQIGRTGGELELLELQALDAAAMRPAIEQLLKG